MGEEEEIAASNNASGKQICKNMAGRGQNHSASPDNECKVGRPTKRQKVISADTTSAVNDDCKFFDVTANNTVPKQATDASNGKVQESPQHALNFPVEQIAERLASHVQSKDSLRPGASVYLAAVLDHVTAEVLQSATQEVQSSQVKQIFPEHIKAAVCKDKELRQVFSGKKDVK